MRGSTKDAPVPSGSRWYGRADLDPVTGSDVPLRKEERSSSRLHTSSMTITSSRRRARPRQHHNHPSSNTGRGISRVRSRVNMSDMGFFPVARDTYYRDRQVNTAISRPRGEAPNAPGSVASQPSIGRGRDSPPAGDLCVREVGHYSSIVDLEEPTFRDMRRPRPDAIR